MGSHDFPVVIEVAENTTRFSKLENLGQLVRRCLAKGISAEIKAGSVRKETALKSVEPVSG
jgi:hypothetical protein